MEDQSNTKKDLLGVLGLLIGIIGIVFSAYTYYESQRRIEPVFVTDPVRTQILDSDGIIKTAPISVLKANGEKVKGDLTAVRFFFWNNGNDSIKRDNILEPIRIEVVGENTEMLDYKILKVSRDITGIKVTKSQNHINSLDLDFNILEPGDGVSVQLLLEGEYQTLFVHGIIEHADHVLRNQDLTPPGFWPEYFNSLFTSIIVFVSIFGIVLFVYMHLIKHHRIQVILHYVTGFLFLLMIIVAFIGSYGSARKKVESSITSIAPSSIMPQ